MDNRSVVFVEIMIAIAIVGVAAFLIYLISHNARKRVTVVGEDQGLSYSPRWYEFVLATIVLLVAAGFILWQVIFSDGFASLSAKLAADAQSLAFFVIMMTVGGIAILAFIIFSLRQQIRGPQPVEAVASVSVAPSQTPSADTPDSSQETPLAIRLLGLALFGLAFLLLNWIYVERSLQHQLMLFVIYPASFAVALVLLLDKASRKWSIKSGAASVREWLICDALVFLLLLGFLNLAQANASKNYAVLFWDFLHIALFFFIFWMVDRMANRFRFLVAYGYFIGLPILLLIWRTVQDVAVPEDISWWSTIWPFFMLAIIFFVLEIISLISSSKSDQQVVPAVKDALFVVIYGILLIVAMPGTDS